MSTSYIPVRHYTPAEIAVWEKQQDPATLPVLDLRRLAATNKFLAEARRREAMLATRAAKRAAPAD